tara:strand:+ start:1416 stop:2135 length:720 start_codon:yes stop_codon:yes gene_type:complete
VKTKFIFDVDGTLTPSRGTIDEEFKIFFNTFCRLNDVYLVTGSDKPKTVEQITEKTYNLCKRVYQCSGSDVWESENNILKSPWVIPYRVRNWLEEKLEESDFNIRTGTHIEQRTGMVNFSVIGRGASLYQRKQYVDYDTAHNERNYISELFNTEFPEFQSTVGGDTGIDIAPRGADKSQILRDFNENDTIHFYGDAMFEGGNDLPLAYALKDFQLGFSHEVKNWEHTWEKLREYFTNRA